MDIIIPKYITQGKLSHRLRGALTMLATMADVLARRALGKPLVPEWLIPFEIATLFFRHQFNHALSLKDVAEGRAYFDSFFPVVEPHFPVDILPGEPDGPPGNWFIPHGHTSPLTMLYFHGGGYTFYFEVSKYFIARLAHLLQVPIFSLDYRLTPEHSHPAQIEDAMAAYRFLLAQGKNPAQLVLCGDSAGGHLVLMALIALREADLPQPALAMALSPWTDIGLRGASQFGNDRYDMVQGYQTLQYGQWLKGGKNYTDAELSPMGQDFCGTAPIYLQAGGREILVDMIRDFARHAANQHAQIRLDVWKDMTHEFHGYGNTLPQSSQAIARLREAMDWATDESSRSHEALFAPIEETELDALELTGCGN